MLDLRLMLVVADRSANSSGTNSANAFDGLCRPIHADVKPNFAPQMLTGYSRDVMKKTFGCNFIK
ncbi:hypothetical protein CHS0354_010669 [Potamilus streckersoni]|uniref:Uncharacterized protein n=1 Tax=Potamilus streckersoni TaxID=2493646 RepID=A0AAE0WBU6_9BIVA|nr:hypothetical protein CHS0354_010669 [Potamilus streckersoni]